MRKKLSIILLDWSVREHFQSLYFLQGQSVPRGQYELIWVECYKYEPVPDIVQKVADKVIALNQRGLYHKHKAYNAGLLAATGELVCICDSDAVFPHDFVEKIASYFSPDDGSELKREILQIYQRRTESIYPGLERINLSRIENDFTWNTWENVSACGVFRRQDMISFGGLDEHHSYRGYFCGYNELVNRMVNAGIPETWISPDTLAIWHFSHPRPVDAGSYFRQKYSMLREIRSDAIDYHALYAVEALISGRLLPLKENPQIHSLRLAGRKIGSDWEKKYADPALWRKHSWKRYSRGWALKSEILWTLFRQWQHDVCCAIIGEKNYERIKKLCKRT